MPKTLNPAERVRAAVQERRDRDAAAQAHIAQRERDQDQGKARRAHESNAARARLAARRDEGREAFAASGDALKRCEQAERSAARMLHEHARDNTGRRDVAEAALDALLARVEPQALERQLQAEAAQFAGRLCNPVGSPGVADVLRLAGLVAHARQPRETADVLRGLLDRGAWAPLTTAEYDDIRAIAKTHQTTIRQAVQDARRQHDIVGRVVQQIAAGQQVDAATPAARVIDANDAAQAALLKLRAQLFPATAKEAS